MNKALCISAALAMALSGASFAGGAGHSKSPRASVGSDTSAQISTDGSHVGAGVSTDLSVGASDSSSGMGMVQGDSRSESSQDYSIGSTRSSAGGELSGSGSINTAVGDDFRAPRD